MVFGGGGGLAYKNDTWVLWLSGREPVWQPLSPAGTPPSPRRLHDAVYDPVRDRMIVFGGYDGGLYNDTWALSFAGTPTWTQLAPSGPLPAPRADFAMVYDPANDRVVVFGGYDGVSPPANRRGDTWGDAGVERDHAGERTQRALGAPGGVRPAAAADGGGGGLGPRPAERRVGVEPVGGSGVDAALALG